MGTVGPDLDAWLETFVARESQASVVDGWVERVLTPVLAENPEVAGDPALARTATAAVRTHWLSFLTSLTAPEQEHHLVRPAAELAGELARRGFPSTLLFRIYRVAQQAVWEYATTITESLQEHGQEYDLDPAAVLVFFWNRASSWLDASVETSVDIFQTEQDRVRQGAMAQRLDAVREILAGQATDPRELSARLGGHPLSGFNTALLLHTDDIEHIPDLTEAATELARPFAVRPLVVNPGGRDLWCWLSTRAAPDLEELRASAGWLLEHGVAVAVGSPAEGVAGFRLSHHEAQEAQRVAFAMVRASAVTLFGDVELLAVMTSSPEAATRFVHRTLGPLADPGETPGRLRQTLRALLSSGSVEEAATRLTVHKNTVRYRVNQAEELLGRKAYDAPTELEVALRYYDTFLASE